MARPITHAELETLPLPATMLTLWKGETVEVTATKRAGRYFYVELAREHGKPLGWWASARQSLMLP